MPARLHVQRLLFFGPAAPPYVMICLSMSHSHSLTAQTFYKSPEIQEAKFLQ